MKTDSLYKEAIKSIPRARLKTLVNARKLYQENDRFAIKNKIKNKSFSENRKILGLINKEILKKKMKNVI